MKMSTTTKFPQALVHTFTDQQKFWEHVIQQFRSAVADVSTPHIASSGGSAAAIFDHLNADDIQNSTMWLVDERYVPIDYPESNAGALQSKLPSTVALEPFKTELTRTEAANVYTAQLKERLYSAGYLFDVTVMGVGPDGHIGSLFPNTAALEEQKKLVLPTQTHEFAIRQRLTLTLPALQHSKKILVLLIGAAKKTVFEQITAESTTIEDVPARTLLDWPQVEVCWLNV